MANLLKLLNSAKGIVVIPPRKETAMQACEKWLFESPETQQFGLRLNLKDGSSIMGAVVVRFDDYQVGGKSPALVQWKGTLPNQQFWESLESWSGLEKTDLVEERTQE